MFSPMSFVPKSSTIRWTPLLNKQYPFLCNIRWHSVGQTKAQSSPLTGKASNLQLSSTRYLAVLVAMLLLTPYPADRLWTICWMTSTREKLRGHKIPPFGNKFQFRGFCLTVKVHGFHKFMFEDERNFGLGCVQGHRTVCTTEMTSFTSQCVFPIMWSNTMPLTGIH